MSFSSNEPGKLSKQTGSMSQHISEQRKDFQNKVSDILILTCDSIGVESLNVSGMVNNHRLAGSIMDAGWSSFLAMLKTKALLRGKNVVEIGRFDPSTRMCSSCGYMKHMELSKRTYACDKCGLTIDRDLNAAINIRKFALIKSGVPTDSGELTPVDRGANTFSLRMERA
ncbi:RNA-guided endonuclease InsQ/TnpB family protein [Cuniculiplasma divulgatum]|uniref:IS200/IS605 family transposase OrfB n=1 Tax=Cuniculiplasma divulgatum TaxID=1673428 RepID=A0A1N5WGW4_9ARCH|nr:RNA-guided endonuclease TnpB family protein [Cuniculiplasma divulgatum]SIM84399.1 IS200/IS605 family transposase OrfB [Cuniculiplasma divulgatum]